MSEPTFRESVELIAPLMEQSARDLAFTTSSLIDSLAMECAELAARLQLIGEALEDLMTGRYMPTSNAVIMALYPNENDLRERTQSILRGRGIHSSTHD